MNLKAFFLSRWTILCLLFVLLSAIFIAYFVPQGFVSSPQELKTWREGHPLLAPYAEMLGLNNIYSSTWFLLALSLSIVSLSLSSVQQYEAAVKKTFRPAVIPTVSGITVSVSRGNLIKTLRRRGYIHTAKDEEGTLRFIKNPWGLWGNFLLHFGIVITLASSMSAALTLQSGMKQYVEGVTFPPGTPWLVEDSGLLGGSLAMRSAVRVESIKPDFWKNGEVRQITTKVSFMQDDKQVNERYVSVNSMQTYDGMRIYQSLDFGHAFHFVFREASGEEIEMAALVPHPQDLNKEGYGDFQSPQIPYLLRVKYFADVDRKDLWGDDPLVTLRLMDKERNVGQAALRKGESSQIGKYNVELRQVGKWTGLVFVHMGGMPGLFAGFFVMVLGAALNYFTPPREFIAGKTKDGYELHWRAIKFQDFYKDEHEKILKIIGGISE